MGRTSTEVKQRWIDANYKRYQISLRYDTDKELMDYIEKRKALAGTTEIFREALEEYVKNHSI